MSRTDATAPQQIVILAAGLGSRLGRSLPKALTELSDGRTIMRQQFDNIHEAFGPDARITVVVGYKFEHIVEAFPRRRSSTTSSTTRPTRPRASCAPCAPAPPGASSG
nr:hypothetical protein GCM10025699_59820 [Microbacterium flavescens]